jgi:hypothetical protein
VAAALLVRGAEARGADRAGLLLAAAEAAVAAGDPDRAVADLRTVLDLVPAGPVRAGALLTLGEVVYVQRPTEALPLLLEALTQARGDPTAQALAHSHIAAMAGGAGRPGPPRLRPAGPGVSPPAPG